MSRKAKNGFPGLCGYPRSSGGHRIDQLRDVVRRKRYPRRRSLTPGHDWAVHKDFSRRFAEALSMAEPDRFTATMSKAKRKGKILIDWLRNQRGSTAVVPYSARARSGAPVAVPIAWSELTAMKNAKPYDIRHVERLIERAAKKEFKGWGFASQNLPDL